MRARKHHVAHFDVTLGRLIEARCDHFADVPGNGFADFFRALVDKEDQKYSFGMIDRDAFCNRVQQGGLSGACGSHDQGTLAVPDWSYEIDCAARELVARLRRTPSLQCQATVRIRSSQ
jgi:hypothetical protein